LESGNYLSREILRESLRFRRPPGPGADPHVSPGGADYRGAKTAGKAFDCETVRESFVRAKMDLPKIRECLDSFGETSRVVSYRLVRDSEPYWMIDDEESAPVCLREVLSRIPIPREIVFQSHARDENAPLEPVDCFVARLPIEDDKLLSIRVPFWAKMRLKIDFPQTVASESLMLEKLSAWAIAPFIQEEKLSGKLFPSQICRACVGKGSLVLEKDFFAQPKWGFHVENSGGGD